MFLGFHPSSFWSFGSPVHQVCMRRKQHELRNKLRDRERVSIVTKKTEMWRKEKILHSLHIKMNLDLKN